MQLLLQSLLSLRFLIEGGVIPEGQLFFELLVLVILDLIQLEVPEFEPEFIDVVYFFRLFLVFLQECLVVVLDDL